MCPLWTVLLCIVLSVVTTVSVCCGVVRQPASPGPVSRGYCFSAQPKLGNGAPRPPPAKASAAGITAKRTARPGTGRARDGARPGTATGRTMAAKHNSEAAAAAAAAGGQGATMRMPGGRANQSHRQTDEGGIQHAIRGDRANQPHRHPHNEEASATVAAAVAAAEERMVLTKRALQAEKAAEAERQRARAEQQRRLEHEEAEKQRQLTAAQV